MTSSGAPCTLASVSTCGLARSTCRADRARRRRTWKRPRRTARIDRPIGCCSSQVANQQTEVAEDLLVLEIGRRRHVVLSVDQLVPLPIVGKQHEVVVGELHAGASGTLTSSFPGTSSILPVQVRAAPRGTQIRRDHEALRCCRICDSETREGRTACGGCVEWQTARRSPRRVGRGRLGHASTALHRTISGSPRIATDKREYEQTISGAHDVGMRSPRPFVQEISPGRWAEIGVRGARGSRGGGGAHVADGGFRAVGHQNQAIGQIERLVDVVRHHHDGLARISQTRSSMSCSSKRVSESSMRERLVEQQEPRLHRQRPRQRHALLRAERQLGGTCRATSPTPTRSR